MNNRRILLHVCCSPCLIYPVKKLRDLGCELTGYFYNPNIHPQEEYNRRKNALFGYAKRINFDLIFSPAHEEQDYFKSIAGNDNRPERCQICWYLRLKKTAEVAKELDFGWFSTTLLVSPYQDISLVRESGERAAFQSGVNFYFHDFRPGYKESVCISKAEDMYRQKYCGCEFSRAERNIKANR